MTDIWDVIVIGAGPAGALAARLAAARGASVLLVDKARFPRGKACGCCLNRTALAVLRDAGHGDFVTRHHARPLRSMRLAAGGRTQSIRMSGSVALSRHCLDNALIECAIATGARFRPETNARLIAIDPTCRTVELHAAHRVERARGRVVIVATGLAGGLLDADPRLRMTPLPDARSGLATILDAPPDVCPDGVITMACTADGYVGMVRLETGQVDVAGAFAPAFVRRAGGPAAAATSILDRAGLPAPTIPDDARWWGAPRLTRAPERVATDRLLVIGDAAGYVEPFTGEGIAWALASAQAVVPFAVGGWTPAHATGWIAAHRRLLARRQRTCAAIARLLRSPRATRAAVTAIRLCPPLGAAVARHLSSPVRAPRDEKIRRTRSDPSV